MRGLFILFIILLNPITGIAQNTVGLINYSSDNADGYVLFSPMTSTKTYLINKCGEKVHEWNTSINRPALSCYLMDDGSLVRTGKSNNANFNEGGSGGILEKFDWNGNLTWSYTISDSNYVQHHDIKMLPNGNILAIVWDRYTNAQALSNGKNTSYANPYLWSEKIIEIQPVGTNSVNIVWEWKVWDHLIQNFDNTKPNFGVISEHPELVNINYFPGQPTSMDWIHLNSIDYNPLTDQILLSSHTLNEIWVIDHSTTTAEAASHSGGNSGKGGDLLYRWGNPQAYQRGNPSTKVFFGQHHATWIPSGFPNAGKILVFNNGLNRPGAYSSIDMIETPINASNQYPINDNTSFLPTNLFWTYTDPVPSNFYSSNISGVYPLSNGSFMITSGANGTFFEVDSTNQTLWKYINPIVNSGTLSQGAVPTNNNPVFRCEFYPPSYPAFIGKNLVSLGEIELDPTVPSICNTLTNIEDFQEGNNVIILFPNPVSDKLTIKTNSQNFQIKLYNQLGQLMLSEANASIIDVSHLSVGIYYVKILSEKDNIHSFKIIKV
jgi:Arylsulfotransferase (ASST)/Secretion system C-terminal sorting domain